MNTLQLNELYNIIKKDDSKSFGFFLRKFNCKDLSFGRFPLLSVCYLYNSTKIIKAYEKELQTIQRFTIVEEDYHIYLDFKTYAKKSIKLYPDDSIVYPIEMLAIMDNREKLVKVWNKTYLNEKIINNITKIYKVSQDENIAPTKNKITIRKKPLSKKLKLAILTTTIALVFITIILSSSLLYIANTKGIGTTNSPIKIYSEYELTQSLKNKKGCYKLAKNINIQQDTTPYNFDGNIDGDGHTISYNTPSKQPLFNTLNGSIKNIIIDKSYSNNISNNYNIICTTNNGIIDNIKVVVNITSTLLNTSDDTYISPTKTNNGQIKNLTIEGTITLTNPTNTNSFVSGVCGINNGDIVNCSNNIDTISTNTVDSAGIAIDNNGTITGSTNNAKLIQTCDGDWYPNCAGICINNYKTIDNSTNNKDIEIISTTMESTKDDLVSMAGGIVCNNYNTITQCINTGNITISAYLTSIYAGGITACNNGNKDNNSIISYCKSLCDITTSSNKSNVFCGGISALNYPAIFQDETYHISYIQSISTIEHCGFEGTIDTSAEIFVVGGIVGNNNYGSISNSYIILNHINSLDRDLVLPIIGSVCGLTTLDSPTYINQNYYLYNENITQTSNYYMIGRYYGLNDSNTGSICCLTELDIPSEVRNQ